jgi:hypothetical protein
MAHPRKTQDSSAEIKISPQLLDSQIVPSVSVFTGAKGDIGRKNMSDDKLDVLTAELRAIELWDKQVGKAAPEDKISRAGFKARRMRQGEIMREIDALGKTRSSQPVTG